MEFAVDSMLGRLCRWLRMLGYDAIFFRGYESDNELINLVYKSSRILLTRDFQLYRKALKYGVKAVYIKSGLLEDQLKQLVDDCGINLSIPMDSSRCPICNHILRRVSLNEVEDKIPEMVKYSSNDFWVCDGCGKVYWIGKHWRDITYKLSKIKLKSSL